MNAARLSYVLLVTLPALACSSSSTPSSVAPSVDAAAPVDSGNNLPPNDNDAASTPDTGASSDDASTEDASADAGPACNTLPTSAPMVNYALSNDSPTAMTGGTVADGTYTLTGYTIYGAGQVDQGFTANQATSITLVVQGTSWSQVQIDDIESTTSTTRTNFTASTSGTAITLTPSCPDGPAQSGTFTATSTAIQFMSQNSGFVISETFVQE